MANWLFVSTIILLLAPLYIWCFKTLPQERWQIICAIPIRKMVDGSWQGLNLTYYGLFNAVSLCAAVALVFILTGAAGIGFTFLLPLSSYCWPFAYPHRG
jgi:hypothetical protein